ncbi:MAG: phenylalanine--tRNA ligase subunit beta [Acidimicrobiales bacterium]
MRVPLSWLREFAPFEASAGDPDSVAALGRVMDDLGMVVEGVETVEAGLDGVVVSRVLEIAAIKGADRIRRVVVDAGSAGAAGTVEVVCGASNFAVGDLVPLATVGTVLPGGMAVGLRRMRGVESHGMLCSGRELGLSADAAGLMILGSAGGSTREDASVGGFEPGVALAEALGIGADVVYDLAIETNRPDAMCVAGVARDLAARLGLKFTISESPALTQGVASSEVGATLVVEAEDLCPRFVSRVLVGLTVTDSAPWLQRRLVLAGMRPINSVVDASNYVMLELGQPTHPYDLERLGGGGLVVRRAKPGETLVTLDGVERVLGVDRRTGSPVDDCLICDADGVAVGIAGVMGGASSEIGPETRSVLLEAAWFDPMAIARTSRRLGSRTEASARFERGCDWAGIERAVARFCQLVAGPGGATLRPGALSFTGHLPERPTIRLRTGRVNGILGTELTDEQVVRYLEPIGFAAVPGGPGLADVVAPSWRPDCSREIDLIEEVARHHGYSSIPRTRHLSPRVGGLSAYQRQRRLVRATLVGLGADEAWTSSMVGPEDRSILGLLGPPLELEAPLAREESVLRASLMPGLVRAVAANAAHQDPEVRLFEVGRIFSQPAEGQELPTERETLGLALAHLGDDAASAVRAWRSLASSLRLAEAEMIEAEMIEAEMIEAEMIEASPPGMHATRSARLVGPGGAVLGVVGEVAPTMLEAVGLGDRRVGWLELDLARLLAIPRRPEQAEPVSRYPSAELDLAFVVDDGVPAAAVEATLARAGGGVLVGLALFDVYRGTQLGPERRSLAYRLRFAALDHTLDESELRSLREACLAAVESAHPAQLRG